MTGNISLSSSKNYYACWITEDGDTNKDYEDDDNDNTNDKNDNKENDVIEEAPNTGAIGVVLVWCIGLAALGYSIYHFRSIIFKKNN